MGGLRTLLTRLTRVGVVLGLLTIGLVGLVGGVVDVTPAGAQSVSCGNVATALDTQYGDTSWAYLADEPSVDACSAPPGVIVGGLDISSYCIATYGSAYQAIIDTPDGQTNFANAANLWACEDVPGPIMLISAGAFNTMCAQQNDPNSRSWAIDPNDAFTIICYDPYTTVTAVSPTSGPTAGGTTVTITGTGFTGASKVLFGAVAATSFTVVSDTQITAVSPAQAAGTHNIYVTTPSGTSAPVSADDFSYAVPHPAVTAVSPTSGPAAGGTTVTITGSGFTGATKVLFGAGAATSYTVVSDTEITAVSPAQAAGTHNIYVTAPGGTSAAVAADDYTYVLSKPAVTGVSPTSGTTAGGTTVTITGSGFTGATKVLFGAVAATSFSVVSDTEITAVSPAQAAATHGIYVTAPGGTSAAVAADDYTYVLSKPAVTGVSPTSGTTAGGTTVTITGSGFTGATKVLFGAVAATSFSVVSDTEITAVSPAQAAATHGIYVTAPGGTSAAVAADDYTYVLSKPAVTGVSPTSGTTAGGTTVTITGSGFTGATKVLFGAVAATSFSVVSDTEITAVSPAQAAATHGIYVTAPGGTSAAVAADDYTYH